VCEGLLKLTSEIKTQLVVTDAASINAWRRARIAELGTAQAASQKALDDVLEQLNSSLAAADQVLAQTAPE
jgi:hypothetical protein